MNKISFEAFGSRYRLETLNSGSIFGAISPDATLFLLKYGTIYEAPQGETFYRYGEKGGSFFVVCEGALAFYKHCAEHCLMTRRIEFGEELGFVSMIALHDHSGHATAVEDSVLLEISASLFGRLHQQYPLDFGLMLMNLSRDLARTVRKLSDVIVEANIRRADNDDGNLS